MINVKQYDWSFYTYTKKKYQFFNLLKSQNSFLNTQTNKTKIKTRIENRKRSI